MILTGENRVWSNGGMILAGENRVWSNGGMILAEVNRSTQRKNFPNAALSATNLTTAYLGSKPGRRV
jgi:hypothetical protein